MSRPLKYKIPGIRRILLVDSCDLPPGVLYRTETDQPVIVAADALEVSFMGVPICEVEESHEKSGISYKSTITFDGQDVEMPPNGGAWIIYDQEGQATLFGQNESPTPKTEISKTTGDYSSRRGATYKITCITAPAPCIFIGRLT